MHDTFPSASGTLTGRVGTPSLPEVHGSVAVPSNGSFWRKLAAFTGPGYVIAVGYMDPGNWASDLAAGAQFGYTLLSIVVISSLMAILLQHLALKLGVATGRDLAQACREHYSLPVVIFLWILCELAIAACDLAEVVGMAIGLQLLFHIPLLLGCIVTCLAVFTIEIVLSQPSFHGILGGFVPNPEILHNQAMLYVSIGIIGATVMPHNLYLHSSIVQTRRIEPTPEAKREAI